MFDANDSNKQKFKDAVEEIKSTFLDEVFDVSSKISREDFIKQVAKKQNFLFKAGEIRKKVIEVMSS